MAIESVGKTATAYQGSGSEKVANPVVKAEPEIAQAEKTNVDEKEKKTDSLNKEPTEQMEITEQRNESLKRAVEEINRKATTTEAVFGIHDATNRVTIKIVDKESRDVIREYPPEKTLDMISKVWELAGMLVDEKR